MNKLFKCHNLVSSSGYGYTCMPMSALWMRDALLGGEIDPVNLTRARVDAQHHLMNSHLEGADFDGRFHDRTVTNSEADYYMSKGFYVSSYNTKRINSSPQTTPGKMMVSKFSRLPAGSGIYTVWRWGDGEAHAVAFFKNAQAQVLFFDPNQGVLDVTSYADIYQIMECDLSPMKYGRGKPMMTSALMVSKAAL